MSTYVCSGCHNPIGRQEPARVFSEPGKPPRFFHNTDADGNPSLCFQEWRREMLLKELTQIERHLKERVDILNDHENWET
jgi:hypothetical protein